MVLSNIDVHFMYFITTQFPVVPTDKNAHRLIPFKHIYNIQINSREMQFFFDNSSCVNCCLKKREIIKKKNYLHTLLSTYAFASTTNNQYSCICFFYSMRSEIRQKHPNFLNLLML